MSIPVGPQRVRARAVETHLDQPIDQRAQAREDDPRPVGPREHRGGEGERGDDGDGPAHRVGQRVGERRHAAQTDERELQLRVEAQPVERREHRPLREHRCGAAELGARGDRAEEHTAAEEERLQGSSEG